MKILLTIIVFLACRAFLFSQNKIPYDSTDANLIGGKHWISDMWGIGTNLGGGVHGFGFNLYFRYSYFGVTVGANDFGNTDKKPTDINNYDVPHGDYREVGFRSALFHITGDIIVPVYSRIAVKGSFGACQKAIEFVTLSNATGWWYKSNKKDETLFTRFVIGGEVNYRIWGRMVLGVGAMSDFGAYVGVGGVF